MYSFLTRNGQTLAFGLGLLLTVIMFATIYSGVGDWSMIADDDPARYDTGIFNFGIKAAYWLTVLCGIVALGFGLYQLATNPKGALKGIIGVGVIIALFFIIKSSASPEVPKAGLLDEFGISMDNSKAISAAVATALGLCGIALLATVLSEIRNIFK